MLIPGVLPPLVPDVGESGVVTSSLPPEIAQRLKRDANGLICAVVQSHETRQVLMVGWMNDDALSLTLTTAQATYWSRSRQELWRKGETSGHVQHVRSVSIDCDGDALLLQVDQVGPSCHTGTDTCFEAGGPLPLDVATAHTNPAEESA